MIPMKVAAPVVALTALVATGCSDGDAGSQQTSSPPTSVAAPAVTLAVPETSTAGKRIQVVVQSTGMRAAKATLFQFAGRFTGKPPSCRDEDVKQTEVVLAEGPQAVDVSNDTAGDVWFVLQAGKLSTPCGAKGSVTRALLTPEVQLRWDEQTKIKTGVFAYSVGVPIDPPQQLKGWQVSVNWFGPYETVPAAQAATCSDSELGPVSKAIAAGSSQRDEGWVPTKVTLTKPGVYRVGWSVEKTAWSTETTSGCADAISAVVEQ